MCTESEIEYVIFRKPIGYPYHCSYTFWSCHIQLFRSFNKLFNIMFFCMNCMWSVVPPESVGENSNAYFLGTQFQAQEASVNLIRKSGPLGCLLTRNLLKMLCAYRKIYEIGARLEHTTGITEMPAMCKILASQIWDLHLIHEVNFSLIKWYRECVHLCG
jgi:hypothetical protein